MRSYAKLGLCGSIALAATVSLAGCAADQRFIDRPQPGGPAYWESQVPEDAPPARPVSPEDPPVPGTRFEEWPALEPNSPPANGPWSGTTDEFLWENEAPTELPEGPAAQAPHRAVAAPDPYAEDPYADHPHADDPYDDNPHADDPYDDAAAPASVPAPDSGEGDEAQTPRRRDAGPAADGLTR